MKITPYEDYGYYDEEYGFSFVDPQGYEQQLPVTCKESVAEFYGDARNYMTGRKRRVLYGSLYLTWKDVPKIKRILDIFSRAFGFPLVRVKWEEDLKKVLITVSPGWLQNGPMVHLFCLLVRNAMHLGRAETWQGALMTIHSKTKFDKGQFTIARPAIKQLIASRGKVKFVEKGTYYTGICDYAAILKRGKVEENWW